MNVRTLVEEHYAAVYRYAYWLSGSEADGEDLTQEVFCCAQQKLHQLRSPAAARSWLYAIVRNCYLRDRRDRRALARTSLEDLPEEPVAPEEPLRDVDTDRLRQLLHELAPEFRVPVVLFYYEGLSYREIAEELAIPMGTVMSRLNRAKAHLRAGLRAECSAAGRS